MTFDSKAFILETVTKHLRKEDFAFTVMAQGEPWDVYRFCRIGKPGMLACRRRTDGQFEIGFFRAGEFTEVEIIKALAEEAVS